jgi:hypothetical protein
MVLRTNTAFDLKDIQEKQKQSFQNVAVPDGTLGSVHPPCSDVYTQIQAGKQTVCEIMFMIMLILTSHQHPPFIDFLTSTLSYDSCVCELTGALEP